MKAADYVDWKKLLALVDELETSKSPTSKRNAMLIDLGMHIALRISDLLDLKWADIMSGGLPVEYIIRKEQKTGKRREIALNQRVRDHIKRYYHKQAPAEYVFINKNGAKLSQRYVNAEFSRLNKKHKLVKGTFSSHSLRKTWARHILKLNPNDVMVLNLLQEALKHSDIRITRRYLGITGEEVRDLYLSV